MKCAVGCDPLQLVEAICRMGRELLVAAKLEHVPRVVRVRSGGQAEDGRMYMVHDAS